MKFELRGTFRVMVLKESKFQDKYNVDVERNEVGEIVKYHSRSRKTLEKKEKKRLKDKVSDSELLNIIFIDK